jgi:hypothetical protein
MLDKDKKSICLVNGSLRGKEASSLEFLKDIESRLPDTEYNKTFLTVKATLKESYPANILKDIACADTIVFAFPLHNYGLPGALMRLLEDYYQYIKASNKYNKDAKVYMIVNCGFFRPEINEEAIRVMKNFSKRLSLNWRFAICIGTGPVVVMTKKVPFFDLKLKRAYAEIISDIKSSSREKRDNYLIRPLIPAPILIRIKNYYEKKGQMIQRNHKAQQTKE